MVAVPITTGRTPAELRALARRERDGRASGRLLALAHALDGVRRDHAARAAGWRWPRGGGEWAGVGGRGPPAWTGSPCATGCTATARKGPRACATGRGRAGPARSTGGSRAPRRG